METFRGSHATYVQAWRAEHPDDLTRIVYTSKIALEHLANGWDIESVTIVRHDNDDREYLKGTIASQVFNYREGARS